MSLVFFFFNDTATTEIYTLSLHDALPISPTVSSRTTSEAASLSEGRAVRRDQIRPELSTSAATSANRSGWRGADRKSTRLNSSHANISYAVFCLKKKKQSSTYKKQNNNTL